MKDMPPVADTSRKRLIVSMTGSSGAVLGIEVLKALKETGAFETHLVISKGAELTIAQETDYTPEQVYALTDQMHALSNIGASIASGTFRTEGMLIVPCSMKTVAGIACGYSDNLILRAADVILKERRKLVLVARETPLSTIHLRNMLSLSEMGAMILPPMVSYYHRPKTLEELNAHLVGKILDQFGVSYQGLKRWMEPTP